MRDPGLHYVPVIREGPACPVPEHLRVLDVAGVDHGVRPSATIPPEPVEQEICYPVIIRRQGGRTFQVAAPPRQPDGPPWPPGRRTHA